jgi:hypothetical protein
MFRLSYGKARLRAPQLSIALESLGLDGYTPTDAKAFVQFFDRGYSGGIVYEVMMTVMMMMLLLVITILMIPNTEKEEEKGGYNVEHKLVSTRPRH